MTNETVPIGRNGEPTTIFVSYARDDRKRALPIIEALEQAGYSVWWDGLLGGGERFSHTTEAALERARAVVVLWSKTSVESHWVHDEATRGRDRRCLVPVSLDGVEAPLGFRQFQLIAMPVSRRNTDHAAIDTMLRAVAALHDSKALPQPAPAPPSPRFASIDRRLLIGGGAAAGVAALAGVGWWAGVFGNSSVANSVAVLPFDNLSSSADRAYFSDGLAAEVRAQLSRNPLLSVAAQASSNRFRNSEEDARSIANKLHVHYLLDGNVRRDGEMLRISAELIDRSGFSQWSQTFDRPLADVFAVQEEIAGAVTGAVTGAMTERASGNANRATPGGTTNVAAYDAYLRGKDSFDRAENEASDRRALAHFDAAIAADARYAIAHSARSRALGVIGNQYDQGAARRATYAASLAAAQEAVRLAPNVAETQSALGFALFTGQLDVQAARAPFDRSYAYGGGDADILSRYAVFNARIGRIDTARTAISRAAQLDPLNARIFRQTGDVEYNARHYADSIPPIRRALEINPQLSVAHAAIGASLVQLGRIDEARAEYALESSSLFKWTGLAIIAHRQGRTAEAEAALARLKSENGDNSLYQQAQIMAQWGHAEAAAGLLVVALAKRDSGLIYLRNDPFIDPVRRHPQVVDLLNRIGFNH
ncbi:MAG: TIR domain-containing protein [Sphingopyxis sp.]